MCSTTFKLRLSGITCTTSSLPHIFAWYNLHYLIATPDFWYDLHVLIATPDFFWCAGHALRSAPKTGVISVGDTHPRTQNQMSYHRKFRNFKNSKSLKQTIQRLLPCPEDEFSFLKIKNVQNWLCCIGVRICHSAPLGQSKKRYHSGSNGKQQKMG